MKKLCLICICILLVLFAASCKKNVPGPQGERGETGAQGERGETGAQGERGETGPQGESGKSAYELAVQNGFEGTLEEWLLSLIGEKGEIGAEVVSVEKTNTTGLTDTYTITFSNGTSSTFTLSNANGISSIEKTTSEGITDTYTITLKDGSTSSFTITNGKDGEAGKTTEFRVDGKWLQWKYTDEDESAWRNLYETDSTPAPEGLVTVKYVTNGGAIDSPETVYITAGTTISLPTPTYAGYCFDGWYESTEDTYAVSQSYRVHQSITLYAKWTPGASVSGTKIYSLNDLLKINQNPGATYVLMNDIDCAGQGLPAICTTQENAFTGLFDGQGFTISNFTVPKSAYMGFIGYNSGTIRNLTLKNGSLTITTPPASTNVYASILCGYNSGSIECCAVLESLTNVTTHEREKHTGLICAYNKGSIKNCLAEGSVASAEEWQSQKIGTAGAIAGGNEGTVENCFADVYSYAYCRGCSSSSAGEFAALIVGRNYSKGKIKGCVGIGSVETNKNSGDVTAKNEGTVESCYVASSVTVVGSSVCSLATKYSDSSLSNKTFYTSTLGWSGSYWSFTTINIANKQYPTPKQR